MQVRTHTPNETKRGSQGGTEPTPHQCKKPRMHAITTNQRRIGEPRIARAKEVGSSQLSQNAVCRKSCTVQNARTNSVLLIRPSDSPLSTEHFVGVESLQCERIPHPSVLFPNASFMV